MVVVRSVFEGAYRIAERCSPEASYNGFVQSTTALALAMVGIFIDLFSIYKWPTTNITAANKIVNTALANWGTSFICLTDFKPSFRGENLISGNLVPGCDRARSYRLSRMLKCRQMKPVVLRRSVPIEPWPSLCGNNGGRGFEGSAANPTPSSDYTPLGGVAV